MTLVVHDDAETESYLAALWYEKEQRGLGSLFLSDLQKAYREISRSRDTLPAYEALPANSRFRRYRMRRFPYVIIFELIDEGALVLAVSHVAQRPGYWIGRS